MLLEARNTPTHAWPEAALLLTPYSSGSVVNSSG